MRSTDKTAKSRMMTFVGVIFVTAAVIAGAYFLFLTPGEPEGNGATPGAGQTVQ